MVKRCRGLFVACAAFLLAATATEAASPPRFERQFLGIRMMSRGINVLRKYGSPSKVLVGDRALLLFLTQRLPDKDFLTVSVNRGDAAAMTPTGPGGPAGTAGPYGPGGRPPGVPPTGPGGPAGGESGGATGDNAEIRGRFVFWVYEFPKKGLTNIFVLDEEGRVVAAGQAGGRPSARTSRGVGIGSTYSSVVRQYGFPEEHEREQIQGTTPMDLLKVSYQESHGVGFFFLNQRLRGYPNFTGQGPWCVGVVVFAAG